MLQTAIIIPTFNERENIANLVKHIFSQNIPDLGIIFVDDNSLDGTAEVIKELAKNYPIQLIQRAGKLGLGSAYIAGFKKALSEGAEFIFEMDADFSHDPADIPRLLKACQNTPLPPCEGGYADMAIGSRKICGGKIVGWGLRRKFMSAGAMWFARFFLSLKVKDVTSGFRCYKRCVLEAINLDAIKSNAYAFQEEMLYRVQQKGFKITEAPVTFVDRRAGKSKLTGKDVVEFFVVMIKLKLKF